jgi:hypothetical protein
VVGFPFVEFGILSSDGVPPVHVGRVAWPVAVLMAAARAWCLWLLLVCAATPSLNKPSYPLQVPRSGAAVSPLAGRGGEGMRFSSSSFCVLTEMLDGVGRPSGPEAAYSGVPKRRPISIAVICSTWSHSLFGSSSSCPLKEIVYCIEFVLKSRDRGNEEHIFFPIKSVLLLKYFKLTLGLCTHNHYLDKEKRKKIEIAYHRAHDSWNLQSASESCCPSISGLP